MKRIIITAAVFCLFLLYYGPTQAKNETAGNQNQPGTPANITPTGNTVQNQNQVKTKNQGEDSQLQISTQESENLATGGGVGEPNQNALQNQSEVAKKVQELLQIRTTGGIGDQVREIAREQNQAQEQIQTELNRVDNRGQLLKLLIGPNYQALKNVQRQIDQNQLRIQQLEQLREQLTNESEVTMVQETIQLLTEQNTALQDQINLEQQSGGLLGWLFKLLAK